MLPKEKLDQIEEALKMLLLEVKGYRKWYIEEEKREAKRAEVRARPDGGEELFNEAKKIILSYGKASASLLQRRMGIGYARAACILDLLEEKGFIGPAVGATPREIYKK